MVKLQEWFVNEKTSKEKGDMYCIWNSYMKNTSNYDTTDSTHFWIAIDDTKNKVVGCVGLISCTGSPDRRYTYENGVGPSEFCELQRMSVSCVFIYYCYIFIHN